LTSQRNNDDNDTLRGKVVLVTGSARGLGAQLVKAAARRRARVVVNCRSDERAAESVALEVQRSGGEALVCRADVADYDQARGLVDETLKAFGRLDVLVNAVGAFSWKPVADTPPAEWRQLVASNLDSVYHMCRLALPHMRRSHWGRIVNLGAVGAERALGQPQVSAYSAAKAAVIAFSRSLALEEARCGITVNVVSPGPLMDDGPARLHAEAHAATVALGDRVPVGRPGCPDDVVRAVYFFVSPAADFLTGQVLAVAGGWQL
jgi:3-oxoacyl-[acyl-carrier protein] reductase